MFQARREKVFEIRHDMAKRAKSGLVTAMSQQVVSRAARLLLFLGMPIQS